MQPIDENTRLIAEELTPPTPQQPQQHESDRKESLLPEIIYTSIENMAELIHEVTEHCEEIAHDLTAFEPLDVDALVAEYQEEIAEEGEQLSPEEFQEEIEELIHPSDPMDPFESHQKIGVIPLAVMVFYNVSGGPFGCETSVRSGGNFFALLGFLVMPLVWSVQEALITAELGTTFPEASGGVAWVEEAFGVNAGWMSGYLGWIAGGKIEEACLSFPCNPLLFTPMFAVELIATDNAIYPVLFLDYLLQAMHNDGSSINPIVRFVLLGAISISLGYINWLGLPVVGKMSVSICVLAMSPFILLTILGAWKVDPNRWFLLPDDNLDAVESATDDDVSGGFFPNAALGGVLWRPFLNNLFWNLNSFDATASFAADIDDPARVLPRALFYGVIMVSACYIFPLLVAIGASEAKQHEWTDGYLARVTGDVVGPWLGAWTVFAAGISNIALFQAELSADAFQLMGMADRGHIPKLFSHRSKHNTPTFGIILGTAVIVCMGVSNLDQLIEMLNFNYAIALLLEYLAFLKLRISRPELDRPWRIPLNTFGCILLFTPTIVITILVLGLATYTTFAFTIAVNVIGMLIFCAKTRSEQRRDDQVKAEKMDAGSVEATVASGQTNQ